MPFSNFRRSNPSSIILSKLVSLPLKIVSSGVGASSSSSGGGIVARSSAWNYDPSGALLQSSNATSLSTLQFILQIIYKLLIPQQLHLARWKKSPFIILLFFLACLVYSKWRKLREEGLYSSSKKKKSIGQTKKSHSLGRTSNTPIKEGKLASLGHQNLLKTPSGEQLVASAAADATALELLDTSTGSMSLIPLSKQQTDEYDEDDEEALTKEASSSEQTKTFTQTFLSTLQNYFSFFSSYNRSDAVYASLERQSSSIEVHRSLNDVVAFLYCKMYRQLKKTQLKQLQHLIEEEESRNSNQQDIATLTSAAKQLANENSKQSVGKISSRSISSSASILCDVCLSDGKFVSEKCSQRCTIAFVKHTILSLYSSTLLFIHCRLSYAILQSLLLLSENNLQKHSRNLQAPNSWRNVERQQLRSKISQLYKQRFLTHHFQKLKQAIDGFFEENYPLVEAFFCHRDEITYEEVLEFIFILKDYLDEHFQSIMTIDSGHAAPPIPDLCPQKSILQLNKSQVRGDVDSDQQQSTPAFGQKLTKDVSSGLLSSSGEGVEKSKKHVSFKFSTDEQNVSSAAEMVQQEPHHVYQQHSSVSFTKPTASSSISDYIRLYDEVTQRSDYPAVLDECHTAAVNRFIQQTLPEAIQDESLLKNHLPVREFLKRMDMECKEIQDVTGSMDDNKYLKILDRMKLLSIFCCSV